MADASIRNLSNHGGDRAAHDKQITLTGSGKAIAEPRAVSRTPLSAEALLTNWRQLPSLDPSAPRADLDGLLEAGL